MWGWILTLLGPLAYAVRGFLPGAGLLHGLKVLTYIAALGGGAWGGIQIANWWHSDKITVAESDQRCADAMLLATVEAKERALIAREHSVRQREEKIIIDEAALAVAVRAMEIDREETAQPGDAAVCVPADDGWLQRWQGRRAAAGDRR